MANREMRAVYTETLINMADRDSEIVVLEADLMNSHGTAAFKERFPERTFNVGVAEANMVGIAAGLSATGKKPFAASFASFSSRKALDPFFISANFAKLNVKLVGSDPGITATFNGGSHMSFEDFGIMRSIPKLIVFEPSDQLSLEKLMIKSAYHYGCTYMRLTRKAVEPLYKNDEEFNLGEGKVIKDGRDIAIIATGSIMVHEAMKASELLEREGISTAIIDMHTIKPIDKYLVLKYAKRIGRIVTCENHQIMNGLGSAISEVLSENFPVLIKRIGINDEFGEVGTQEYLQERFGLNYENIKNKAKELMKLSITKGYGN